MIKSLLLTRTNEENQILIDYFKRKKANFDIFSGPLLEINYKKNIICFKNYDVILFTSFNAVKAIKNKEMKNEIIAFCVGNKTSAEAEKLGFNVLNANGNAKDLLKLIHQKLIPRKNKILYLRGKNISLDLKTHLQKYNYDIEEKIVYSQKEKLLSVEILNNIEQRKIDSVAIFSSNSVITFSKCVKKLPNNFKIFCLSAKIANSFKNNYKSNNLDYSIAKAPNIESFCELLLANFQNR